MPWLSINSKLKMILRRKERCLRRIQRYLINKNHKNSTILKSRLCSIKFILIGLFLILNTPMNLPHIRTMENRSVLSRTIKSKHVKIWQNSLPLSTFQNITILISSLEIGCSCSFTQMTPVKCYKWPSRFQLNIH
jgi:hypothetical protein